MTQIENEKTKESSNITFDELLGLKKNLAKEVIDKLVEKDSNLMTSIVKGSIRNYLVDENTLVDVIHDEVILGGLGELTGLITPTLKKYREMFSKVSTKNELENLRTTIFNEIGGTELASTTTKESSNTTADESSNTTTNEANESAGETEKKSSKKEESGKSKKETSKGESKKDGGKDQSTKTNEKTSKKEKEEVSQEGLDKEKKTYTNPKSGLTYKCFDQVLDPASSLKDKTGTVASRGCLLASGATITSAFCPSVTLKDCFKTVNHRTADKAVEKMSNNKWTAKALLKREHGNRTHEQCQKAQKEIEENLQKGYPAVIGARHKGIDGINPSIVSQHYRAIVDMRINNGKKEFFVANTYKNRSGGWFSEDKIFKNMIHASIFKPSNA